MEMDINISASANVPEKISLWRPIMSNENKNNICILEDRDFMKLPLVITRLRPLWWLGRREIPSSKDEPPHFCTSTLKSEIRFIFGGWRVQRMFRKVCTVELLVDKSFDVMEFFLQFQQF
jgi:hypothetical protein